MIGGISYFHEFAYDLMAENERITAAAFDAAIDAHRNRQLQKITVLSSSMVYESTYEYPTPEGAEQRCPPPKSTYGFQKLATEYFVRVRGSSTTCRLQLHAPSTALELAKNALCAMSMCSAAM